MHFFTDQDLTNQTRMIMAGDDAHHLLHVLRAARGTGLEMTDGCGRTYECMLSGTDGDQALLDIVREIAVSRELPCAITLYPCMTKGDKMALIVQKATELGVSCIAPVISARTVARPDAKSAAHKQTRWQKIAESAAKQCGRTRIPEVAPVMPFDRALAEAAQADLFLLPYEGADENVQTRQLLEQVSDHHSLSVMIGPEGGFSQEEVAEAEEKGAQIISLGHRILRAETAAITALSWLVYQLEL